MRFGQVAVVGGHLLLAVQRLVEGQRFPDYGLGLLEVSGFTVQVSKAGIGGGHAFLAVQGLVDGERLLEQRLGALELAADRFGQLVVRAATKRSYTPRLVLQEGLADHMRPAQEERSRGDGSPVAALVTQRHGLVEARLRPSEIAGALLQDAERDPGVGSLRIELGEIDLRGVDLHGVDLRRIEQLGLLRLRRLLGACRLGSSLGRGRHARLGGLGRLGRGFRERLPVRGLRPHRRTDARADQQSSHKDGGTAQVMDALARYARHCSHGSLLRTSPHPPLRVHSRRGMGRRCGLAVTLLRLSRRKIWAGRRAPIDD